MCPALMLSRLRASLLASLDLGLQNVSFFAHNYGAPRTFNPSAAKLFDYLYGGGEPLMVLLLSAGGENGIT